MVLQKRSKVNDSLQKRSKAKVSQQIHDTNGQSTSPRTYHSNGYSSMETDGFTMLKVIERLISWGQGMHKATGL